MPIFIQNCVVIVNESDRNTFLIFVERKFGFVLMAERLEGRRPVKKSQRSERLVRR